MATIAISRRRSRNTRVALQRSTQAIVAVVVALGLMWAIWHFTSARVRVSVDGRGETIRTHRRIVSDLILDLGIDVQSLDRVTPAMDAQVYSGSEITIERARPVQVSVDGRLVSAASWHTTARQVLNEIGIKVDSYDEILVDGMPLAPDGILPSPMERASRTVYESEHAWSWSEVIPLQIQVNRAVPITINDSGLPFTIRTTAETVGEALRQAEITVYLGDHVEPSLGSAISAGLRVFIGRSTPLRLQVDGQIIRTRTRANSVADALSEMHIGLSGLDRVTPGLNTDLYEEIEIEVTRVSQDVEVEEEIAPFETVYVPDANLAIDTQQVVSGGAEGITRSRFRSRYEDNVEVERELEDTWIAQEPVERVISYGQKIEPKVITAEDGTRLTYWRKIRMLASSYSASTAGVSPDKAYYGRTYTGEKMGFGVVAVDPKVIPLRSRIYVNGYGSGEALDIGSAIRAKRIDLGYDDDNLVLWNKWVDVYLLWPPPPEYQITWVIPNWPPPPQ